MNIVHLIAKENAEITAGLQVCLDAADPAWAREVGRQVAARMRIWLSAEARVLFPAMVAVSADPASLPLASHRQLKRCVAALLDHKPVHDRAFMRSVLQLQQLAARYARHETTELSACLTRLFSEAELRQLRGAMVLELSGGGSPRPASGQLDAMLSRWLGRGTQRRPPAGARTMPTLYVSVPGRTLPRGRTVQHR